MFIGKDACKQEIVTTRTAARTYGVSARGNSCRVEYEILSFVAVNQFHHRSECRELAFVMVAHVFL